MNFQQSFRLFVSIASIMIGIYFFMFAMEKNLGIPVSLTVASIPFARTFLRIAYEIRRGEVKCQYLNFIKRAEVNQTEHPIKYDSK